MRRAVVVIVRNDLGQVLLFERREDCCFLGKTVKNQSLLKVASSLTREMGLEVEAFNPLGELQIKDYTIHGFLAPLSGGKLVKLPTDQYVSASWVAPSLAVKIPGVHTVMQSFLERLVWV